MQMRVSLTVSSKYDKARNKMEVYAQAKDRDDLSITSGSMASKKKPQAGATFVVNDDGTFSQK